MSNFLIRASYSITAAPPIVPADKLKPLMKKWLSMEDDDAAEDIAKLLVDSKDLQKGKYDIEYDSAEHGVLDIFFGDGQCLRVKKNGTYYVI